MGTKCKQKNCKKVGPFEYGSGVFCSSSCARSYSSMLRREETNKKVSAKLKGRSFHSKEVYAEIGRKGRITKLANRGLVPWDKLGRNGRRIRVIDEQGNRCLNCSLDSWMGLKLTFELDHIDGNHQNNNRKNLRALCPNCHSQTPTWRKSWKNISR